MTMNTHASSETTLFDFRAPTSSPAWQIVNDDVMGGVSTSRFQILTNGGAVFSGVVSLENNGGFASVRSSPLRQNLSGLGTFVLRVRGDGHRYKFTVRTETGFDTPLYQGAFATKRGEWEEHRLPFQDFVPTFRGRILTGVPPLNPAKVTSVGFLIADKQDGAFRLEISWVKALPTTP
jgi:monofunctional biosynthetic peptidoglycan transglycosylase